MIRNIISLFITVISIVFFSTTCFCQDNTVAPADAGSSITGESVKKDEGTVTSDEKKEKSAEEKKKEEEDKKAKEEKEKTEEETLNIQEENLDTWGEDAPPEIDSDGDVSNNIWRDDQGFIDR